MTDITQKYRDRFLQCFGCPVILDTDPEIIQYVILLAATMPLQNAAHLAATQWSEKTKERLLRTAIKEAVTLEAFPCNIFWFETYVQENPVAIKDFLSPSDYVQWTMANSLIS